MQESDLILDTDMALPYLLSVPQRDPADAGKPVPVLCFLHGLDEGPPTEIYTGMTAHGPLRQGSSPLATRHFIVVAPQLPTRGDLWRFYADAVYQIVEHVQGTRDGDRCRTYLTGFSFGGNGVFDLALRRRDLWAALWPVDPTRVPETDPGLSVWLSSGQASRPRSRGFVQQLRLEPAAGGAGNRVYTDEGLDHVGTATSAYRTNAIYDWLLSKRLEKRGD